MRFNVLGWLGAAFVVIPPSTLSFMAVSELRSAERTYRLRSELLGSGDLMPPLPGLPPEAFALVTTMFLIGCVLVVVGRELHEVPPAATPE